MEYPSLYGRKCAGESDDSGAHPLFERREIALFIGYFAIYLFVYFPLCLRNGLHWDEMFDVAGAANGTYVAAGRWMLALYRYVLGLGYMPVVSGIVAGLYIAAALLLQVRLLGVADTVGRVTYGALYIGCVQWATQLQYSHQSDAVAFALLLATVAVCLYRRGGEKNILVASLLVVCSCAVYQTSMLYLVVLLFAVMLRGEENDRLLSRELLRGMIFLFCSGCVYLVSRWVSVMLPVLTEQDVSYMNAVQLNMSKWKEIADASTLEEKCSLWGMYTVCYIKVILKNLLGMKYEGQWVYATTIVPVISLLWRWGVKERSLLKVILLTGVWVVPFAMALVVMTDQGARTSLAEPLACACIWMLWGSQGWFRGKLQWVLIVFAGVVVLKGAYRVAVIAEDESNEYASKMNNLVQLNARLVSAAENAKLVTPQFVYFGEVSVSAHNGYERRWGKRYDDKVLMRLPDGRFPEELTVQLRRATAEEQQKLGQFVEGMPVWPAPGAVSVCGETVVVKFEG